MLSPEGQGVWRVKGQADEGPLALLSHTVDAVSLVFRTVTAMLISGRDLHLARAPTL